MRSRARHAVHVWRRRQTDPFAPRKMDNAGPGAGRPAKKEASTIYAKEAEPLLVERRRNEEEVAELLDLAAQVEGLPRNVRGMHAGGVLIAPGSSPISAALFAGQGSAMVSQFDKDDVEAVGLVRVRLSRSHHPDHPRLDDPLQAARPVVLISTCRRCRSMTSRCIRSSATPTPWRSSSLNRRA